MPQQEREFNEKTKNRRKPGAPYMPGTIDRTTNRKMDSLLVFFGGNWYTERRKLQKTRETA
jgi:hypothetical protein